MIARSPGLVRFGLTHEWLSPRLAARSSQALSPFSIPPWTMWSIFFCLVVIGGHRMVIADDGPVTNDNIAPPRSFLCATKYSPLVAGQSNTHLDGNVGIVLRSTFGD